MIIPYTTERRADTGVTNVTLGMWLFIASEIMLFGALFSAYALLRSAATDWPHHVLSLLLGTANTVVLLILTTSVWRARRRKPQVARGYLLLSTSAAFLFVSLKSVEYGFDDAHNLLPHVNTFLAMYFTLTGLHLAHVIAGIVANVWVVRSVGRIDDAMFAGRVQSLTLYWTFVDIVWLLIFLLMYLL